MTTKKLVVGYDGSAGADAAAGWALDEASRTGGTVEFVYAYEWPVYTPAAPLVPGTAVWPDAETEKHIATTQEDVKAAAAGSHPDVAVTTAVVPGLPAPVLCQRSRAADLVVLGSHGHGGWAGLLLGSTSVAVSAHAHCPVVIVRSADTTPATDRRVADGHPHLVAPAADLPVIAGLDGSPCAELALGFAFEQAAQRGAPLRVVRALPTAIPQWAADGIDLDQVMAIEESAMDHALAAWRRKFPEVTVSTEVVLDHPGHALVDASGSAQLVVVGSRGRGGFRGLLLGSISQQLLHHARCPVAVVRERSTGTP